MAPRLIVEVVADVSKFVKSMSTSTKAANTFQHELKSVSVDARAAANAQVAAAVKTTEALHGEVAAYREIARAAERGSKEQIAAARLAASAQHRLDASLVGTTKTTTRAHGESKKLSRELEHGARGAISGSHAFEGFGRSLAFASGGFLALEGASSFIRESINAAREAGVAQRSLAAQMKASGESFAANREEIERVAVSYGKFGFQNDEVIASLTILERGTGNLSKAMRLQGLTADLARAKSIDLSKAATVIAKVFGGQETALRRAVPGLAKNAHGWDLIRQAQQKLAGQAAANTTAAERFGATLHDTQEIVGLALLPTLNRYLTSLGEWLQKMNESGQLQKDVASTTKLLSDAISVTKAVLDPVVLAFKTLGDILGGTRNEMKLLAGVFITFKTLKIATSIGETAAAMTKVGTEAAGATGKVAVLRGSLIRLVANPYTIAIALTAIGAKAIANKIEGIQKDVLAAQSQTFKKGSGLETTLIPDLSKQIERLRAQGKSAAEILAALRKRLGGSLKADDLIAEAFAFSSGSDPKLRARIEKQVADLADTATKAVGKQTEKFKATPAQRNTWFDALIGRELGGVQDVPELGGQVSKLRKVAAQIEQRIAVTKDITRKLNLEDKLADVRRQIRSTQEQIAGKADDLFDSQISRVLGRVGDLPIAKQLGQLQTIAAQIAQRIALTRDVTRKQTLEDQLYSVMQQQKQVRQAQAQASNDLFDSAISRTLERGGAGSLDQQLATLHRVDALLTQRIAATTEIIRKRQLEDQLWDNALQERAIRKQKEQSVLDWLQFDLERAGVTKTLADDVKVERQIIAELQRQIKMHGRTLELARLLFNARQSLKDLLSNQKKARKVGGGNGVAPPAGWGTGVAFGMPTPSAVTQPVSASPPRAYADAGITINNLNLHGVQDVRGLSDELVKVAGTRPQPRRGP